jgi:hypothetical protein
MAQNHPYFLVIFFNIINNLCKRFTDVKPTKSVPRVADRGDIDCGAGGLKYGNSDRGP